MSQEEQRVLELIFREKYDHSGDVRYAALAFGANPDTPPVWAVEACEGFFAEYDVTAQRFDDPPTKGPKLKNPYGDGAILALAAEWVADGHTINAALETLLGESSDGTHIRRLHRIWRLRSGDPALAYDGQPIYLNRWTERLARRGQVFKHPPIRPYRKVDEPQRLTYRLVPVIDEKSTRSRKSPRSPERSRKGESCDGLPEAENGPTDRRD